MGVSEFSLRLINTAEESSIDFDAQSVAVPKKSAHLTFEGRQKLLNQLLKDQPIDLATLTAIAERMETRALFLHENTNATTVTIQIGGPHPSMFASLELSEFAIRMVL